MMHSVGQIIRHMSLNLCVSQDEECVLIHWVDVWNGLNYFAAEGERVIDREKHRICSSSWN